MNNTIKIGDTITVVTPSGNVYSAQGDISLYNKLLSATEEEIQQLVAPEVFKEEIAFREETKKIETILNNFDKLVATGDFDSRDGALYMKDINRSIPSMLADRLLASMGTQEFDSLKKFWMWCCLNPRAEVADSLFDFLTTNHLRVNSQGFFYALRNVVTVAEDTSLVQFVSEEYSLIKMRKKGPKNYSVLQNPKNSKEYKSMHNDKYDGNQDGDWLYLGNLAEMYVNLPNDENNRYTDAHTHTFDIRIGQRVHMNPEDCNWTTADCGHAGLHFTMDQIHYVGCGDTSVIMLINPAKVVGIGSTKGRCYEYLPICTIPRDSAKEFLRNGDFDTLEMEADFVQEELADLEIKVKENFAIEAKKYSFNLPSLSSKELTKIVTNLGAVKEELSNRVYDISDDFLEDSGYEEDEDDYDYDDDSM